MFLSLFSDMAWGGVHVANGGVSGDQASDFYARFGGRRAIRRGRGGHKHTNPLPPGCDHYRNIHHVPSYQIKTSTLNTQSSAQFLRALWAGDVRSNEGEGGVESLVSKIPSPECCLLKNNRVPVLICYSRRYYHASGVTKLCSIKRVSKLKTTCSTKLTHKKELEATNVYNQARIHVEKY